MPGSLKLSTASRRSSRSSPIRCILDKHVRATAGVNRLEGAGQIEAPRGTLNHHYKVDENGIITWANLVVATGHNNYAMNQGVLQSAKAYVKNGKFTEGALNRVEAVIRTFDPCLSCSTHAFGQMPLILTLVNADGEVVDRQCVKIQPKNTEHCAPSFALLRSPADEVLVRGWLSEGLDTTTLGLAFFLFL